MPRQLLAYLGRRGGIGRRAGKRDTAARVDGYDEFDDQASESPDSSVRNRANALNR
jgi:hypothetical protein